MMLRVYVNCRPVPPKRPKFDPRSMFFACVLLLLIACGIALYREQYLCSQSRGEAHAQR